jgi:hypothetical protein
MEQERTRPEYEKPQIKDYGDLRELTQAQTTGTHTDVPKGAPAPFILSRGPFP